MRSLVLKRRKIYVRTFEKAKFGVEVEFTGITRTMAAEAVAEILGSHAAGPDRTCYRTYTIRDSKRRIWKVMRDSSICPVRKAGRELMDEYRVEFVTPPLNYEDIETLQTIIRKFKELGGVSHSSCGIHIHVDGANHTATSLRRLVNFFSADKKLSMMLLQWETEKTDGAGRYVRIYWIQ